MFSRGIPIAFVGCLVLAACGGGGDDDTTDTSPTTTAAATDTPTTTAAPATTVAPTTTEAAMVVEGATVVVANSSIVGGAAGRMTDELTAAGFTTATATNGTEKLVDSIVHYTDDDGAQPVAESVAAKLGGVEVSPMPDPIPTEDGTLGGAQVLVLLGNNQADRTLDELGGTERIENSGSTVVVANDSGVQGAAGQMTSELSLAGFETGEATNGVERREDSLVHYTDAAGAESDAALVAELLGGVDTAPMPDPIPTETGDLGGAQVLVLLGTNQAGQPLESLNP